MFLVPRTIRMNVTVGIPVSTGDAVTTLQSSVAFNGVTFTFDRAMPVGQFVTGDPFVISDGPFSITAISPAAGDLEGDGHVGNGAMKDPYITGGGTSPQGWDSYLSAATVGPDDGNTTYDPAVNVDPAISGPIAIARGEETSIVKTLRAAGVRDPNQWKTFDRFVTLTVLATEPDADGYMPAASGLIKHRYRRSQLQWDVFRTLDMSAAGFPSVQTLLSNFEPTLGFWGQSLGEYIRRYRTDGGSNYSAEVAPGYGKAAMFLHSTASQTQKQAVLDRFVAYAIHAEGLHDRGWRGLTAGLGDGAGQVALVQEMPLVGAFALGSAAMLAKIKDLTGMFDMPVWGSDARNRDIGQENTNKYVGQPYYPEMWGQAFISPDADIGSNPDSRYGPIAYRNAAWAYLPVAALQNGPSGETGQTFRGTYAVGDDRTAWLAVLDELRLWEDPWISDGYDPGLSWQVLYDAYDAAGLSKWDSVPLQPPPFSEGGTYFFPGGAGEVAWNYGTVTPYTRPESPVTRRDLRYSLDGIQWIVETGVSASGVRAGLLRNTAHFCGFRWVNRHGNGPWSLNYARAEGSTSFRNRVVTAGTPSAIVPSFTVPPVLHRRFAPKWERWGKEIGNYVPAEASLPVDVIKLKTGLGYVNGDAPPSFAFQWKRNGTAIAGATAQEYVIARALDRGTALTCTVTPSNSAGSGAAVTTAAITVPAPQAFLLDGPAAEAASGTATLDIALGPANPDRWLLVLVTGKCQTGGSKITGLNVGGTSCTLLAEASGSSKNESFAQVWVTDAKVPTGTTATLTRTGSVQEWQAHAIWVSKATQPVLVDHGIQQQNGLNNPAGSYPVSLDVPAGGLLFAVLAGNSGVGGHNVSIAGGLDAGEINPVSAKGGSQDRRIFAAEHVKAGGTRTVLVNESQPGGINAVVGAIS